MVVLNIDVLWLLLHDCRGDQFDGALIVASDWYRSAAGISPDITDSWLVLTYPRPNTHPPTNFPSRYIGYAIPK